MHFIFILSYLSNNVDLFQQIGNNYYKMTLGFFFLLKQQKFISLYFWRLEIQDKGASMFGFL